MIDRVIHTRYRYNNNNLTDIASIQSNVYPVQWVYSHRHLSKMLSVYTIEDVPHYYNVLSFDCRYGDMYKSAYWNEYGKTVNI